MRTQGNILITGLLCLALVAGAAVVKAPQAQAATFYDRTAQNFIVLFDSSGSMEQSHWMRDASKLKVAKDLLRSMNMSIPDLGYNAGLYLASPFKTLQELGPYDRAEFSAAIDQIPSDYPAGGYFAPSTFLGFSLDQIGGKLINQSGRTVIFIFSDGLNKDRWDAVKQAQWLDRNFDVCFHVVSFAEKGAGIDVLRGIAGVNECSRILNYEDVAGDPGICLTALCDATVVQEQLVVVTPDQPKPETPPAAPQDTDGDGVIDANDICPATPVQYAVDERGCAVVRSYEETVVLFDFDKSDIRSSMTGRLDEVGRRLREHPEAGVSLAGYADAIGPKPYNMDLSRRRANSVKQYLTDNFGIKADRITVTAYGEEDPVVPNDSPAHRQQNRRVEINIRTAYQHR